MEKLKGYKIGNYRIRYKRTKVKEGLLYIYDKDNNLVKTFELPAYVWISLFIGKENPEEVLENFGKYIIEKLGL